jgi:alpha-N-arabinofuranosidase
VYFIDSASAWDKENKHVTVFAINRNEETDYPLTVDLKGFEGYKPAAVYTMRTDDLDLKNSFENDTLLQPTEEKDYTFENGELKVRIQPLSWNVYVFEG